MFAHHSLNFELTGIVQIVTFSLVGIEIFNRSACEILTCKGDLESLGGTQNGRQHCCTSGVAPRQWRCCRRQRAVDAIPRPLGRAQQALGVSVTSQTPWCWQRLQRERRLAACRRRQSWHLACQSPASLAAIFYRSRRCCCCCCATASLILTKISPRHAQVPTEQTVNSRDLKLTAYTHEL